MWLGVCVAKAISVFCLLASDARRLSADAKARGLDNVAFHDEIEPAEIPGLYSQCHVGIVALDPRHKAHNLPGKFLSYMQALVALVGRALPDIIYRRRVEPALQNRRASIRVMIWRS